MLEVKPVKKTRRQRELLKSGALLLFLLLWLVWMAPYARGEEIPSRQGTLSLIEAVEHAWEYNLSMLDSRDAVEISRSALRIAEEETFDPTVTLKGSLGITGEFSSGVEVMVQDVIPLRGIGIEPTDTRKAEIDLEAAVRQLLLTRDDVTIQVMGAYFNVLTEERIRDANRMAAQMAETAYEDTLVLFGQRNATKQDLLGAEQRLIEAEFNLERSETALHLARERLNRLLGLAKGARPVLENTFVPNGMHPDLASLLSRAREDHPGLLEITDELEKVRLDLDDVRRARQPRIGVTGTLVEEDWSFTLGSQSPQWDLGWELRGQVTDRDDFTLHNTAAGEFSPRDTGWGAGIEVTWVPFDGGMGRERERQGEIRTQQLERRLQARRDTLELDIEEAYQEVLRTANRYQLATLSSRIEHKNFVAREQQMREGFITDREFHAAEYQFLLARLNEDESSHEAMLALARLYQTAGVAIPLNEITGMNDL